MTIHDLKLNENLTKNIGNEVIEYLRVPNGWGVKYGNEPMFFVPFVPADLVEKIPSECLSKLKESTDLLRQAIELIDPMHHPKLVTAIADLILRSNV